MRAIYYFFSPNLINFVLFFTLLDIDPHTLICIFLALYTYSTLSLLLFNFIMCDLAAVGKSAILTRFSENAFLNNYSSTIGIDFNSRMIRVDHAICKLEIWDTAGE